MSPRRIPTGLAAAGASLLWIFAAPCAGAAEPAKAAVSPLFQAYQDLCLATGGEPARALTAADARGWRQPPAGDELPLGLLSMSQDQQRETTAGGARLRFAVARADDPAGLGLKGASWRVCIVSREPDDPGADAALKAWAAVAPAGGGDADPASSVYVIADPDGPGRRSAAGAPDAELQALAAQRRLVAAGAKTLGPLSLLLYAAPGP